MRRREKHLLSFTRCIHGQDVCPHVVSSPLAILMFYCCFSLSLSANVASINMGIWGGNESHFDTRERKDIIFKDNEEGGKRHEDEISNNRNCLHSSRADSTAGPDDRWERMDLLIECTCSSPPCSNTESMQAGILPLIELPFRCNDRSSG